MKSNKSILDKNILPVKHTNNLKLYGEPSVLLAMNLATENCQEEIKRLNEIIRQGKTNVSLIKDDETVKLRLEDFRKILDSRGIIAMTPSIIMNQMVLHIRWLEAQLIREKENRKNLTDGIMKVLSKQGDSRGKI